MKKLVVLFLFVCLVFAKAFSQIPNNDFEIWTTTSGYPSPSAWDNLNQITNTSGIYTCIQGSPGYSGASYLYLMTKTVPGKGVVPGVAVCGEIDTLTYKAKSGFPFSARPLELTYYMQYMPYDPADSSNVKVLLTKWNSALSKRDSVAYGETYFYGMAHSWVYRTTTLNYYSGDAPDSAIIVVSASDDVPLEWSYIYMDNMQFNGTVAGIDDYILNSNNLTVFPNPSNGNFIIEYNLFSKDDVSITLTDVLGRNVYTKNSETGAIGLNRNEINIELKNGFYNLILKTENEVSTKKIIINKN